MVNFQMIIAGFGGQGVLFAGKFLAYAGLIDRYEVSWLPSYGPEMRGGTANCSVVISEEPVGSPVILKPNVLIALNGPSYDKFVGTVEPGGKVFIDSSLITAKCDREDVDVFYIPSTQLAADNHMAKLANVVMTGKFLRETGVFSPETYGEAMKKCVPPAKAEMLALNMKALEIGLNYEN